MPDSVMSLLASISGGKSYKAHMTEKLYKEVKKIATERNNFLNEGEFR